MKQFILFGFFVLSAGVLTDDSKCGAGNEYPVRPCPENNKTCVRAYFRSRTYCKADVAASDTLRKDDLKGYLPYFNLTVDQNNATIGGLSSGKIVDFLADNQKNLLVLTVNFVNITLEALTDFIYYQSAEEPRRIRIKTTEQYQSVTITTIFYSAKRPKINDIFSVANVSAPNYTLGSCASETKDPALVNLFSTFNQNSDVAAQEAFQTRSRIIAIDYIQKNLCNYGVKP